MEHDAVELEAVEPDVVESFLKLCISLYCVQWCGPLLGAPHLLGGNNVGQDGIVHSQSNGGMQTSMVELHAEGFDTVEFDVVELDAVEPVLMVLDDVG